MEHIAPEDGRLQTEDIPAQAGRTIRGVTWRYLGDRTVADAAYCARFDVRHAPEPMRAPDGAWAYALPGAPSLR